MDGEDRHAEVQVGHISRYDDEHTATRLADSWFASLHPSKVLRQVDIYEEGRPVRGTPVALFGVSVADTLE